MVLQLRMYIEVKLHVQVYDLLSCLSIEFVFSGVELESIIPWWLLYESQVVGQH